MPRLPVARFLTEAPPNAPYEIKELPDYCSTKVFVIHAKSDKADLYAWLSEEHLELVRGPEEDVLRAWMMSLDPKSCRKQCDERRAEPAVLAPGPRLNQETEPCR